MEIDIDPDIRKAKTIPSKFYHSLKIYNKLKILFDRSWQFIGDTDLLEKNNAHPGILLEGMVDEPYLLTKDKGNLECLSNVCTHRGNILCNDSCKSKTLVCGYHGRQFEINGKMKFMPEFDNVTNFPNKSDNLSKIEMESWKKMIFITNEKKCDLSELIEPMVERLAWLPVDEFKYKPELFRTYKVNANWALYCDNYLEGFHIPFVHNDLNKELKYEDYFTQGINNTVLQMGIGKDNENTFDLPENHQDYGKNVAAYYFFLFPNMMFNFYPWGLSINVVKPKSPEYTEIEYFTYVWKEELMEKGAGANLDKVELEDEKIVESVQKGIKSNSYDRGRYSPKREIGVHYFHSLLQKYYN
jgi:choline monooxygenase|tara:strand:- start:7119 stop:8189 length:1071 start_codon:yes stop_codon:yes gene_type:complete